MKKQTLKYVIDACLFIDISTIAVLGLLLGFVIPRGEGGHHSKTTFLGLGRHEWGDIHLYLSIFLLALLVLHLILNWQWIVLSTRRYFGSQWKNVLWCASGAWLVVLMVAWFFAMI
jgi:hypothetical protein